MLLIMLWNKLPFPGYVHAEYDDNLQQFSLQQNRMLMLGANNTFLLLFATLVDDDNLMICTRDEEEGSHHLRRQICACQRRIISISMTSSQGN
jgi:hypothetical protein